MQYIIALIALCSIVIALQGEGSDLTNLKALVGAGPICIGDPARCQMTPRSVCKATGVILTVEEYAKQCPSGCTQIN